VTIAVTVDKEGSWRHLKREPFEIAAEAICLSNTTIYE